MAADLIIAPEAERDLIEAYGWYQGRRGGLGEEFLSSVDAAVEGIRRGPAMYSMIFETYRRCLVRRFPYAIFYEYAAGAVTVYGILHTARDPAKWRERLT